MTKIEAPSESYEVWTAQPGHFSPHRTIYVPAPVPPDSLVLACRTLNGEPLILRRDTILRDYVRVTPE